MRPLYKSLAVATTLPESDRNAGLWYDKFCGAWSTTWTLSSDGESSPKLTWIETITNGEAVGQRQLLGETAIRMHRLTEARRGIFGIFVTESRFVTGLGRSHPVENGFAWHPTLGVPYLPGSSVKGLVRAWARHGAEPRPADAQMERILGRAAAPRSAGRVVFLDALPIAPVRLEADVMTPHFTGWTPDDPPGDWCEPVPVPFLVVAPQSAFLFSLLPCGIEQDELASAFGWLRDALRDAGAGAKTAVGYGRFAYDEARTTAQSNTLTQERAAHHEATRRAELAQTPEGRVRLDLERKSEADVLELVRLHLEKQPMADLHERRAFARAVAAMPYLAHWRKGKAQDPTIQTGADKIKTRARLVDAAAAEADPEPSR